MIVARPTRWSRMRGGTLPLRNPGIATCEPTCSQAWSMLGFSSSWDTSTVSLTVVASRVSTALFTAVVSLGRGQADDDGRCALDRRTGTGARPHDPTARTRGTHATASSAGRRPRETTAVKSAVETLDATT